VVPAQVPYGRALAAELKPKRPPLQLPVANGFHAGDGNLPPPDSCYDAQQPRRVWIASDWEPRHFASGALMPAAAIKR